MKTTHPITVLAMWKRPFAWVLVALAFPFVGARHFLQGYRLARNLGRARVAISRNVKPSSVWR